MCGNEEGTFRCVTCIGRPLFCQDCCLHSHSHIPFHEIREWKDGFFQSIPLRDMGFKLHLGHCGNKCPNSEGDIPLPYTEKWFGDDDILLVDTTGVHRHRVAWCNCLNRLKKPNQLLQMGLYPATLRSPATAFSFQVLDYFYLDFMECQTSAFSFYSKLCRLSNNVDPDSVPVMSDSKQNFCILLTDVEGSLSRTDDCITAVE